MRGFYFLFTGESFLFRAFRVSSLYIMYALYFFRESEYAEKNYESHR